MRMPPDQFVRRFANDFADVEAPVLPGDLRMHDYQQEQIAKFLSKMRIVFRARSLRHFVSFFNQCRQQGFMRFLPVTRTAAVRTQIREAFVELIYSSGYY